MNSSTTDSNTLKIQPSETSTTSNAKRVKITIHRSTTDSETLKVRPTEISPTSNNPLMNDSSGS